MKNTTNGLENITKNLEKTMQETNSKMLDLLNQVKAECNSDVQTLGTFLFNFLIKSILILQNQK